MLNGSYPFVFPEDESHGPSRWEIRVMSNVFSKVEYLAISAQALRTNSCDDGGCSLILKSICGAEHASRWPCVESCWKLSCIDTRLSVVEARMTQKEFLWPRRSLHVRLFTFIFHTSYLGHCGIACVAGCADPKRRWRSRTKMKIGLYPRVKWYVHGYILSFPFTWLFYASVPCKRNLRHIKIEDLLPFSMSPPHYVQPLFHSILTFFSFIYTIGTTSWQAKKWIPLSFRDKLYQDEHFFNRKISRSPSGWKKWVIMIKILGFIHHILGFPFMWIFDQFLALICCFYTVILWGGRACTWM